MSKKFNVNTIVSERRNELDSSPLFQIKTPPAPAQDTDKSTTTPLPEKTIVQEDQPVQDIPERSNARTPVRPSGKRIITRNSFEIYEDQMDALRKHSFQEKMEGKLGSMSQMVRDALDAYLKVRAASKSQ
jgi:hypothetical protein